LQDFITDIEAQDLRRTEQSVQQSVLLVREKYEATKVLEVGDKVKKLGRSIVIIIWRLYPTNGSVMSP
jgi:hypothetical protein